MTTIILPLEEGIKVVDPRFVPRDPDDPIPSEPFYIVEKDVPGNQPWSSLNVYPDQHAATFFPEPPYGHVDESGDLLLL